MKQQHPIFDEYRGWSGSAPNGQFVDFIGDRAPASVLNHAWRPNGLPPNHRPPFDEEYFEWIDVLEAVKAAGSTFTFLELGAGYGRWSVRAACAARQLGKDFRLGLAEAAPVRVKHIHEVMALNEIDASRYRVFETCVGVSDEEILFAVEQPEYMREQYWGGQGVLHVNPVGAEICGEHEGWPLWRLPSGWGVIRMPQAPLSEVLQHYDLVDLADFDLQGAEADAIQEALPLVNARVKRLHIGTHGAEIEEELRGILGGAGWRNIWDFGVGRDNETPFGRITFIDGVQGWINPNLA